MKDLAVTTESKWTSAPLRAYLIEDALCRAVLPFDDPRVLKWQAGEMRRIQAFSVQQYGQGEVGQRARELLSAGISPIIVIASGPRDAEWANASEDVSLPPVMVIDLKDADDLAVLTAELRALDSRILGAWAAFRQLGIGGVALRSIVAAPEIWHSVSTGLATWCRCPENVESLRARYPAMLAAPVIDIAPESFVSVQLDGRCRLFHPSVPFCDVVGYPGDSLSLSFGGFFALPAVMPWARAQFEARNPGKGYHEMLATLRAKFGRIEFIEFPGLTAGSATEAATAGAYQNVGPRIEQVVHLMEGAPPISVTIRHRTDAKFVPSEGTFKVTAAIDVRHLPRGQSILIAAAIGNEELRQATVRAGQRSTTYLEFELEAETPVAYIVRPNR